MELLNELLPILLYISGIVLLIVLIVLAIKLIQTVDRCNLLLDDIEKKSSSLNGIFHIIDTVTDAVSGVTYHLVDTITSAISHLFQKREKEKEDLSWETTEKK